ncbi:MAG: hypothetical protein RMK34_04140 [Tepidimonas sp.]|uniref:hypothetical protein n=1 Tax=Tepidimonas sp. TaxID=2002775 RepID=UPI00298EF020|nr:hypothetical protein [Tepidimonas sp.]MDW8336144.1 hypothetical protein [Tepidimonas sp.]
MLSSLAASVAVHWAVSQEKLTAVSRERTRALNHAEALLLDARKVVDQELGCDYSPTRFPYYKPNAANWNIRVDFLGKNHVCSARQVGSKLRTSDNMDRFADKKEATCARFRLLVRGTTGVSTSPTEVRIEGFYEVPSCS